MRPLANSGTRLAIAAVLALLFSSSAWAVNQNANMTETLTTTASVACCRNAQNITEGDVTTDAVNAHVTNPRVSLTENHTTTDALSSPANHPSMTETHTTTASCAASICHPAQITDGSVTTDSVKALKSQTTITETHTTTDAVTGVRAGPNTAAITETLTTTPSVTGAAGRSTALSVTVTESDSLTGIRATHSVVMTETLTESDSLTTIQCIGFPSEFSTTTDGVTALPSHVANMQESLFTNDSTTAVTPLRYVPLSETHTTSPALTVQAAYPRAITETLSHSDSIGLQGIYLRAMSETVGESDSIAASKTNQQFSGTMSESLAFTDSISATSSHFAAMSESLTEGDSVSGPRQINARPTENLTESDSTTWQSGKGAVENLTTTATLQVFAQHPVSFIETVGESDSVAVLKNANQKSANMVEALTGADSLVITAQRSVQLSVNLTAFDSVIGTLPAQQVANIVESLLESDAVIARRPRTRKRFILIESQ